MKKRGFFLLIAGGLIFCFGQKTESPFLNKVLRRIKVDYYESYYLDLLAQWVVTERGAFTGATHIEDAIAVGVNGIIAGHSETEDLEAVYARRELERELQEGKIDSITQEMISQRVDERINKTIRVAHQRLLKTVIVCLGESAEEKESGSSREVVERRLLRRINGLSAQEMKKTIIAYEPKWAITGSGRGETASPEYVETMHSFIRERIARLYGEGIAHQVKIIYGGSVSVKNPQALQNTITLAESENIDGFLVGSASTDPEQFLAIIEILERIGKEKNKNFYLGANWKLYIENPNKVVQIFEHLIQKIKSLNISHLEIGIAPNIAYIQMLLPLVLNN